MEDEKQYYTIVLRHDTSTNWMVNDPILYLGEYGVEDDTHRVKRGDGESKWSELKYEEFGLRYLITFNNIQGEVADNEQLQAELDKKISASIFQDVGNSVVDDIYVTQGEDIIANLTKISKDVLFNTTSSKIIEIKSHDHSILGYWSTNAEGVKTLDLRARSSISDYEPDKMYYIDQLCFYNNRLYRALDTFTSTPEFEEQHWTAICSLLAKDIKYDNKISHLEANNVKDAIDELADYDGQKVIKTNRPNKVYGTNEDGDAYLYDKDSLRTVDTVNRVPADARKNIQIDATQINYDDTERETKTIKTVLDSKVDKLVAGSGEKIVKSADLVYDTETGALSLEQVLLSLEDGSQEAKEQLFNMVSEQELANTVDEINDRIDTEVATLNTTISDNYTTLNTRITDEVSTLNNTIDTDVNTLDTKIDTEVTTLNNTITAKDTEINARIDDEVATLNTTITTKETALSNRIDANAEDLSDLTQTVADNKTDIETQLTNAVTTLQGNIDTNDTTINARVDTEVQTLNDRIDTEVATLNTTINTKESTINTRIDTEVDGLDDRIDTEVATLNATIDDEVDTLNDRIDTEVATINTAMTNGLNTKIDKDIADSIVTNVQVATESGAKLNEPTLKITSKNTDTETEIIHHLHFKEAGSLEITAQNDHILFDVTTLDDLVAGNSSRITQNSTLISGLRTDLNNLTTHDIEQDTQLANHSTQIATLQTQSSAVQTRMTLAEQDIDALETENATQEAHLTTHDQQILANTNNITANANAIIETNRSLSRLADEVDAIEDNKVDKTFAATTGNEVVGSLVSRNLTGNAILDLLKTSVSPVDGTSSTETIKIISSDNTVVATKLANGVIDIATNLDTDVNYFIFIGESASDRLNDRIGQTTIVPLSKLEAVTKQGVEVRDIITDMYGTWARVQSIDTVNEEVTAMTFNKQADAVWGTIKGNIAQQQDLQNQFTELETDINTTITAKETALNTAISNEITARTNADNTLQGNIDAEELARQTADTNLDNAKVDKVTTVNQIYGTDANGAQTTYGKDTFGKVDTVNNVTPDNNKNVTIVAGDIDTSRNNTIQAELDDALTTISYSLDNSNGLQITTTTLDNTSVTKTLGGDSTDVSYEANGNVGYKQKVNTENVDVDTTNTDLTEVKLGAIIRELSTKLTNLQTNFEAEVKVVPYTQNTIFRANDFVYVDNNDITYMARVAQSYNSDFTKATVIESFVEDIRNNNLIRCGIPAEVIAELDQWKLYTEIANVSHMMDPLDSNNYIGVKVYAQNINDTSLNQEVKVRWFNNSNNKSVTITSIDGSETVDLSTTLGAGTNTEVDIQASTLNYIMSLINDTELTNAVWESAPEPEPEDAGEAYNVLNEVLGDTDAYEGMGGTEAEVEAVLDEILGEETPTPSINIEVGHTYRFTTKENPTIGADNLDNTYGIKYITSNEYPRDEYRISIYNNTAGYQVAYACNNIEDEDMYYNDFNCIFDINTMRWVDTLEHSKPMPDTFTFTVTSLYQDREWTTDAVNMLLGYFDIEDITE